MAAQESHSIKLAEYAALRSEITTFLSLQVQFMSYSIALGGVIAGLSISQKSFEVVAFFPLPFLIFGLLYLDAKGRILRAAKYIHNELRPTLIDPAEEAPSLTWESFIREESDLRPILSWADKLRWALFLVPSLVPIIWWLWIGPQSHHRRLVGSLFTLEFILFFLFVVAALKLESYDKRLCKKEN